MLNINNLAWDKNNGLMPAIIQDAQTAAVLMLGYMNQTALQLTLDSKYVVFYSRSRDCLWKKGETSGNYLKLVDVSTDCDKDSLLILVQPEGHTCHLNRYSCFEKTFATEWYFLDYLSSVIAERAEANAEHSYVAKLTQTGITTIAKKVGEEAVETALAALEDNASHFKQEMADLFFHCLVLLFAKKIACQEIIDVLKIRHHAS